MDRYLDVPSDRDPMYMRSSPFPRCSFLAILLGFGTILSAQYNAKGALHLLVGMDLGAHATEYDQTFTIPVIDLPVRQVSTGGAATLTIPLEVHYGFAPIFSLGVYAEPGRYVDSVESRQNRIAMFGIQPRFYLVNKERFAWMASLQIGATRLTIDDVEAPGRPMSIHAGGHFGLGTGVGFLFSDAVGLQLHVRLLANTLPLQEYEVNGAVLPQDLFDAELRARGLGLQASLHVRL